jgi:hypothetical protein
MIKNEDDDEAPNRADLPFPQSTARDVQIETSSGLRERKICTIRCFVVIFIFNHLVELLNKSVTGPGLSVCMFTFHNTYDGYVHLALSAIESFTNKYPRTNTTRASLNLEPIAMFHDLLHLYLDVTSSGLNEAPNRADLPFPQSTARDVQIEVKKVMEHRDRFEIIIWSNS